MLTFSHGVPTVKESCPSNFFVLLPQVPVNEDKVSVFCNLPPAEEETCPSVPMCASLKSLSMKIGTLRSLIFFSMCRGKQ